MIKIKYIMPRDNNVHDNEQQENIIMKSHEQLCSIDRVSCAVVLYKYKQQQDYEFTGQKKKSIHKY